MRKDNYWVQALHGDVTLSSAARHAAVSAALLKERRAAPRLAVSARVLRVGSAPDLLSRERCCFQLSSSK
eukprot:3152756-Amphidinium_carterae.1